MFYPFLDRPHCICNRPIFVSRVPVQWTTAFCQTHFTARTRSELLLSADCVEKVDQIGLGIPYADLGAGQSQDMVVIIA